MTVHFNAFRGATHPKNLHSLIIYSPQCWWKVRKVIFLEFHILNNWISWCITQKNKHKMTPYSSSGVIQVQNCFVHCSFHLTKTVKIMKLWRNSSLHKRTFTFTCKYWDVLINLLRFYSTACLQLLKNLKKH